MGRILSCLLALVLVLCMGGKVGSVSNPTEFIRASCRSTRYFDLCIHCLSGYAGSIKHNERNLALTALSVSLERARSAHSFVTKMGQVQGIKGRQYQAVRDCIETMGDSVDGLRQSVRELSHMGGRAIGQEFLWHISNVQTWVSAALTDENTCLDGFSAPGMDGNVKAIIRRRIVHVAQVTSNGLALVNRFAAKHSSGAAISDLP